MSAPEVGQVWKGGKLRVRVMAVMPEQEQVDYFNGAWVRVCSLDEWHAWVQRTSAKVVS